MVRDGKPYPPGNAAEMEIQPDAERSLEQLKAEGFRLLVVTNQPDVAAAPRPPRSWKPFTSGSAPYSL